MRLTRITLFFIALILGLGFYRLIDFLNKDLEAQTLQVTEESLADTANLLANLVEKQNDHTSLKLAFDGTSNRPLEAQIFKITKTKVGINAYLTDQDGIILFDSKHPQRVGKNFSTWNDVSRTLKGNYGARSTRAIEDDDQSSVLYIGAPVYRDTKIIGCLTAYKNQSDVLPFAELRRKKITSIAILIGSAILALITVVFLWLFRPVGQLTNYARAITKGERRPKPKVGVGREVNTLANALHDMRESLEGRKYVDQYIQSLTHELKSPLAAIQGAAELLHEEMPLQDRQRFTQNIRSQTDRCQQLINRLLELSALESQTHLDNQQALDFTKLCQQSLEQLSPLAESAQVKLTSDLPSSLPFTGNPMLLESAINHLLENAIQFSPSEATVTLTLKQKEKEITLTVTDQGPGIPDFAAKRAFEKFYSYRENSPHKSHGLGLAFVKEAVELHNGHTTITKNNPNGTTATITLPL